MPLNFSQLIANLSVTGKEFLHRQVVILAGQAEWQKKLLQDLLSGHEKTSLWVSDEKVDGFPFVDVKKAASWLGKEKQVAVFDANEHFNPDSFAAISGIVVGGGVFFLLLPEKNKWNEIYSTRFGQRLINSINNNDDILIAEENDLISAAIPNETKLIIPSSPAPRHCDAPFLTLDQQRAVEAIQQQVVKTSNIPVVLVSDRGRGKSAALGIAAARLLQAGVNRIAITAPSLSTTDVTFKHIVAVLPEAEVTRGCVKFVHKNKSTSVIHFYSPDNLMQENIAADVLLVDEAAAIPVPLLASFLHQYRQCVFATTVHGYEGTGRGFSLRFYKELDKKNKNWLKLQMQTPIRWADKDPLEKWMFDLLCLDAEISNGNELTGFAIDTVEHCFLDKEKLDDNKLLNEVFSLLVLAHYRTRPKDLKNLLDDETISVYVSLFNDHVVAVALVIREGNFSDSLSTEVYQGKRRPQGNLLAQALTYHCGIEHAATFDYARIMRIAVHPALQQRGVGTAMIDYIVNHEKQRGRDAIGSSFGMNTALLAFWKKAKFEVVRIGFTREKTSGEHAVIMLLALTAAGKEIKQAAYTQFCNKLGYWFEDLLNDLPEELKASFSLASKDELVLSIADKNDLHSFIHYSRNYELCISALNKFIHIHLALINQAAFPANFRQVLVKKVVNKESWKEITTEMTLHGQNEARNLFHAAVMHLFNLQ